MLENLKPSKVWENFELLCSVPHGSGNTKAISDLLVKFANDNGIEVYQDELGNVIMTVPATPGHENAEPVFMQAHMDMVCVKDDDLERDMATEPIHLVVDGNFVKADRTSLGADDCIGCAIAMAVLTEKELEHGLLQAVFTVDEETGMYGAYGLDMSKIMGRYMLNLDSENEGTIICGCAGGVDIEINLPLKKEAPAADDVCYKLVVSGLLGGHSGEMITLGRANANRLLSRLIYGTSLKAVVKLAAFTGGKAPNAITDSAEATVYVSKDSAEDFERLAKKHQLLFRAEKGDVDPDITVSVEKATEKAEAVVSAADTKKAMRLLASVPDGLRKLFNNNPAIAETSSNLGIVRLTEEGITANILARSSADGGLDEIIELVKPMAEHDGATIKLNNPYPAWSFKEGSRFVDIAKEAWKELYNEEMKVSVTHGGVEGGIFSNGIKNLEGFCIGPFMHDIHSPRESVEIASTEKVYDGVKLMIRKVAEA
ncbi:MAG: beta-Ala-His dipeptidase [Eubacteriales bacterium]|nr:beta-Ala-His dipeptidase [Eubacteriales bacterium]